MCRHYNTFFPLYPHQSLIHLATHYLHYSLYPHQSIIHIDTHYLHNIHVDNFEGFLHKFSDTVAFSHRDHEILRFFLLKHQPHCLQRKQITQLCNFSKPPLSHNYTQANFNIQKVIPMI